MRVLTLLLLTTTLLLALSGCSTEESRQANSNTSTASTSTITAPHSTTTAGIPSNANSSVAATTTTTTTAAANREDVPKTQQAGAQTARTESVSLSNAQDASIASERKIIRNADLSVETNAPAEGQRRITSLAESRGGFVVNSETKQTDNEGAQAQLDTTITLVVRVPSTQFGAMLDDVRKIGSRVRQEKITGQDVTEEYVDLEARIKTKKALEVQFLEIMKRAGRVTDALEVQTQLGEVRTDIERLEGRRRLLENQSSLSTITVTLQPPALFVHTSGFFNNLKSAFGDGIDVAATITLALIRFAIVMIPITLFVFLPLGLLARYLIRRGRRRAAAERELQSLSDN
jgi:hypothetical protein